MEKLKFSAETSVSGRQWALKDQAKGPEIAGIHPTAVALAVARGFEPEGFFTAKLKDEFPDPSVLKGMDDAVNAFCNAVISGKKIALYGDYDVDGATSTSLLVRWLARVGVDSVFYIPDRIKEGYGPNSEALRRLKAEHDIEFITFLDCGTRAHAQLAVAEELGMEIIILDHHLPDDRDPPGILVNPSRRDETLEYSYLCTAGLAFVFLVAVNREMRNRSFFTDERPEPDLREWMGLVALGTVCDMVPLKKLNRVFVRLGLEKMDLIPGIRALKVANSNEKRDVEYNEHNCGFVFGPCINAEGRIGDTRSGALLLSTDDEDFAAEMALKLVDTNKERQDITKAAQTLAIEIATTEMTEDSTIVIYNEDWHQGIVGIVASKVKDAVNKPTVIIGRGGSGSCRSVTDYSIGAAVDAALEAGVIDKGGGHKMAAGLHVKAENVAALRKLMCSLSDGFVTPPLEADLALACGTLTPDLIKSFESLRPFGMGNPQPRLIIHGGYVTSSKVLGGKHIELTLLGRIGTSTVKLFNGVGTPLGDALAKTEDKYVDVYGRGRVDFFRGRHQAILLLDDAIVYEEAEEVAA